jgi:hypothetical protein
LAPRKVDIRQIADVGQVPIVLKKSRDERNFSGPLMHFVRDDVRGQIVSHKNCHRPSYQR